MMTPKIATSTSITAVVLFFHQPSTSNFLIKLGQLSISTSKHAAFFDWDHGED
jgi:hypothetical protein